MVQNMRAYFILYVITIKCINCMQEKTELSFMLQRPRLISTKLLGDLSLATEIKQQKQQYKSARNFSGVAKRWHPAPQGWQLPTPCHPIATGLGGFALGRTLVSFAKV